jgi:hypothetical protein
MTGACLDASPFIFHFSFGIFDFLLRVRSCDFVDRFHRSAKRTIHEITKHHEIRKMRNDKWKMENAPAFTCRNFPSEVSL